MKARMALEYYGPLDIPKKDKWVICATGPSLEQAKSFCQDATYGVMAVNAAVSVLPRVDVAIFGHYEDCILNYWAFDGITRIFIPDPCDLGSRAMMASTRNLFDYDALATHWPGKIRFFTKEFSPGMDIQEGLYVGPGIAHAALSLLAKNGVRECRVFGVDGGLGHHSGASPAYQAIYREYAHFNFDRSKESFFKTAERLGITVTNKELVAHGL